MPWFKVTLTRKVSYEETATTEIEADDEEAAIAAALEEDHEWTGEENAFYDDPIADANEFEPVDVPEDEDDA
jgi:hypothetical protein